MPDVAVGVDGAPGGWAAVRLRRGRLDAFTLCADVAEVLAFAAGADVLGVDMPLGHEDPTGALQRGRRRCDAAAQAWLGPRRASIFLVPPPDLFEAPDHAAACRLAAQRGGLAPSAQVWRLGGKMRAMDAAAAGDPRLREVHPEVSFQAMLRAFGGGDHLQHAKRSLEGRHERLALLNRAGLRPSRSVGGVGRASPEDVLDATAAAWSAARIAAGTAATLPADPPSDPRTGRPVAIWY